MKYEDALIKLIELGFHGCPGNDQTVELSLAADSCGHEYHWCDLRDAGVAVVDLLRPQEGVTYDAAAQAMIERWNEAQLVRAKERVAKACALQEVMGFCS